MQLSYTLAHTPIVFLDFDGVLNTINTRDETDFTQESIVALNALYALMPYKIVLSTSWKDVYMFSDLADLLHGKGI